ncbi:hypothetical protein RvY_16103 [Ramazzottius varieornatus]|uniref:DDE-1 domain-containing protein n=1 Tax=Ramazzottius varieornatus TaxID=947166 RepID=A0A1D1VX95_RAMVA|nr:hypothetical protein RvY_16103 [Ramazzottius varieornatus]
MYKPLVLFDGIMHLKSMFDNNDGKLYIAVNGSGCVVLCDGHYSHVINAQLFKLCRDSGTDIKLICLPAGQTDKLQPLDNCTFGCMKVKWTNYKASKRLDPSVEMTRNTFAGHLALLCTTEASRFSFEFEAPLKSGFKNTGIFPFSPETIRATVDKKLAAQDAPALPVLTKERSPMKDVAEILRSRVPGDDDKIDASIESIVSIYGGHKSVAETVVAAAGNAFSFSKPKEQKKPKDQRLALERGRKFLDTEYVAAIKE